MSKISLVGLSLRFMAADRTAAAVYFLTAVRGMVQPRKVPEAQRKFRDEQQR